VLVSTLVHAPARAEPGAFLVGTAAESIAPSAFGPERIYVGGVIPGPLRPATGNRATTWARAVAISSDEPGSGIILVQIQTQGRFAAYRQGPYGTADAQREVAAATGLPAARIIMGTNHTHADVDELGLWGGAPARILQFIKDQSVKAAISAWNARRPARLSWASTHAPELLQNQSIRQGMDDELRLLVANDPDTGAPIAFVPNWQGHPSIVPGNELHPDWPGILDETLQTRHPGSFSMAMPGDVGHTQSGRQGNTDEEIGVQKATEYATELADRLDAILPDLRPVTAGPVTAAEVFFTEDVTNAFLLGTFYAQADGFIDLYRSHDFPWLQGPNTIGARTFTARVGDVALGAVPGEAYPSIFWGMRDAIDAAETFMMGLAGDTLGYLVSPEEDWALYALDVDDNLLGNVSPSVGDHVMCDLIVGASAVGFALHDVPARCARWRDEPTA
jgi:hypothetical protein